MPKDRTNKISCSSFNNEMEIALEVISGKWKVLILTHLYDHESVHYNEFRKLIPQISQKMLSQQLKNLEENGLVLRIVHPTKPPMVEYKLADIAESLIPILHEMGNWGKKFVEHFNSYHADNTH